MKKQNSTIFMLIGILFVALFILSNISAFKVVQIGPFVLTAATFLFPLTYIINDVIAEVYGYQKAKIIIWTGFALNILTVLFFRFTMLLPSPVFFTGSDAYNTVFGGTWRILIASMAAYLIGSFLNAFVMSKMKVRHKGKFLAVRAVLSTLIGEGADSLIFVTIAFIGTMPGASLVSMILTIAVAKVLYEIIIYPITSVVIKKIKQIDETDEFATSETIYNPFKLR